MPLWVSVIRDKIVDEASDALVARHTECEWSEMKRVLTEYFGDKRDLCGLVSQICYLKQNIRNITDFYNECRELLSDIVAKLSLDSEMKKCIKTLSKSYEDMILNSFIDGLNEPYARLTRATRPTTLLVAYQSALEQYNADQRRKEKFPKTQTAPQKPPFPQNTFHKAPQQGFVNRNTQGVTHKQTPQGYYNTQVRNHYNPQNGNNNIPQLNNRFIPQNNNRFNSPNGNFPNGNRFIPQQPFKPQIKQEAVSHQTRHNSQNVGNSINYHEDAQHPPYDPQYEEIPNEEYPVENTQEENQEQETEYESLNFHMIEGHHQTE